MFASTGTPVILSPQAKNLSPTQATTVGTTPLCREILHFVQDDEGHGGGGGKPITRIPYYALRSTESAIMETVWTTPS